MRVVERDKQLVLTEGRLGNAAAAAVTFACGAPTLIVGLTTLRISASLFSNVLWIFVGAAVVAASIKLGWDAVFDERWVFDRRTSEGELRRSRYVIGPASGIERVEIERSAAGQYEVLVVHGGRAFCVMSTANPPQAKALADRLGAFLGKSVRDSNARA